MAIAMVSALKDVCLTAIGAHLSGGFLELQASNNAEIATLGLSSGSGNAINTVTGTGSSTYKTLINDSSATGGVVTKFEVNTSGDAQRYTGTVTSISTGTGDLLIASTTIAVGAVVSAGDITVSFA